MYIHVLRKGIKMVLQNPSTIFPEILKFSSLYEKVVSDIQLLKSTYTTNNNLIISYN